MKPFLTSGEVAAMFGVGGWQVRRALDGMGVACPRAAGYRLISRETLPQLAVEFARRGWLSPPKEIKLSATSRAAGEPAAEASA